MDNAQTLINPRAAIIAKQNDAFRAMMPLGGHKTYLGQTVTTRAVAAKGFDFLLNAQIAVAAFNDFNEENDPYGDHTFGVVTVSGERLFWKIDLYDLNFEYGSDQPENPERTRRVLTIMLPSDY
ncbi:DUF3768 domain-containing protein [Roseinatronobacter monicus]|uniref:Uncharacterized protein DUF3768 n=1 Tax=Roseinatronobacter monicus TaxID=393481 RepID=A0A543K3S3_9RHOB|nr:DUF3768 domain-containing protein [Roseinatronobacter monicus]TQM89738.1 uncharacterized protein DUF3768 [Roseinatronobacter monicus]